MTDQRLQTRAPTTVANESVGADGGFAVPPLFRSEITTLIEDESFIGQTNRVVIQRGSFYSAPVDETAPWDTTAGVQAKWIAEQTQLTQGKMQLKLAEQKLNKLGAILPVTDELLHDSPMLGTYVKEMAGTRLAYQLNRAILAGTGAGQPLGILNSNATVSVAKDGSQTADTITKANLTRMWARLSATSRSRAAWICHPDAQDEIYLKALDLIDPATGNILGRPVIATEACEILGDVGDIILADLSRYLVAGPEMALLSSAHLWFDQDISAFRIIWRIGGQPLIGAPVTSRVGGLTRSPFITLDARA